MSQLNKTDVEETGVDKETDADVTETDVTEASDTEITDAEEAVRSERFLRPSRVRRRPKILSYDKKGNTFYTSKPLRVRK